MTKFLIEAYLLCVAVGFLQSMLWRHAEEMEKPVCPSYVSLLDWAKTMCLVKSERGHGFCFLPCGHEEPHKGAHGTDLEMAHNIKFGRKS